MQQQKLWLCLELLVNAQAFRKQNKPFTKLKLVQLSKFYILNVQVKSATIIIKQTRIVFPILTKFKRKHSQIRNKKYIK